MLIFLHTTIPLMHIYMIMIIQLRTLVIPVTTTTICRHGSSRGKNTAKMKYANMLEEYGKEKEEKQQETQAEAIDGVDGYDSDSFSIPSLNTDTEDRNDEELDEVDIQQDALETQEGVATEENVVDDKTNSSEMSSQISLSSSNDSLSNLSLSSNKSTISSVTAQDDPAHT